MAQEIKMPSAGQTTDEATIVSVNIKPGDTIKRGDVLMEAETDKAVLPVESFLVGQVLEVCVKEGDKVDAGTVLAIVGKPGETVSKGQSEQISVAEPASEKARESEKAEELDEYQPISLDKPAVTVAKSQTAAPAHTSCAAMPNAKLLAKEMGIDISRVPASNGEFVKRCDVLNYKPEAAAAPAVSAVAEPEYTAAPLSRMRNIIAKRMTESVTTIPSFTVNVKMNVENLMKIRETFVELEELKLSINDIIALAIAKTSLKFPLIRSRVENGEVRTYTHCSVGLAVGLEDALVVPVVKNVDTKSLIRISAEYKELVKKARENKLLPSDMGCGCTTISNLGMFGVDSFSAIINPPESSIFAISSAVVEPEWNGKEFVPVKKMTVSGVFDHRIMDGSYGAKFMKELKKSIEHPCILL